MNTSVSHHRLRTWSARAALAALLLGLGCGELKEPPRLEAIRALHEEGRYRESLPDLRALVDANPADGEANLLLGTALLQGGDAGLAVWPLRRASEHPRYAVPAGLLLARAMLDSRTAPDSLPVIHRVLELEPDNLAALALRSRAYLANGNLVEALADIDEVLARDPHNVAALVPRVTTLIALDLIDDAEAALATARERLATTDEPISESMRARLCIAGALFSFEKGDLEIAESQYADCLEAHPKNPLAITETAAYYDRSGRPEDATKLLEEMLATTQNSFFRLALARRMRAIGNPAEEERLLREEAERTAAGQAWFNLADLYVNREQFDEAVLAFEEALAAEREPSTMLRFAYADTLVQAERYEQARNVANALEEPALRDLILGRIFLAEGDAAAALEAFSAGIRLWPNNPSGRFMAGEAAEALGDFERAMSEYRESLRAHPGFTRAGLSLAELQAISGQDPLALDSLNRHLRARPQDVEALILTARVAHRTNRYPLATRILQRLAALPGHEAVAVAEEAGLLAADKGAELAVAAIERSQLDLNDPANLPALESFVEQLAELDQHAEAEQKVTAALQAHPEEVALLTLLGRVRERAGKSPRESYEQALVLVPNYAPALAGLGALAEAAGDHQQALALYARSEEALPGHPQTAMNIARVLAALQREEEARERLETVLRNHPREAEAVLQLAELLVKQGELERAAMLAERASWFQVPEADEALERIRALRDESATPQDAGAAR